MSRTQQILYYVEKYLIPIVLLLQVIITSANELEKDAYNEFVIINKIIKPILLSVFMFLASKQHHRFNPKIVVGLIISYSAFYFVEVSSLETNSSFGVLLVSTFVFYILFGLYSIIWLGKNFSILPSATTRKITTKGPYSIIRHPIYSSYIHFFATFVLVNPTPLNFSLFILFVISLKIRSNEEEIVLNTNENYSLLMDRKPAFFHYSISFPIFILIVILVSMRFTAPTNKTIHVNIGQPIYSLNPLDSDDWSSFFVINHIYPRFKTRGNPVYGNSIFQTNTIACEDNSRTVLSPDCKTVVMKFKIKKDITACNGKKYSLSNFHDELEMIVKKKNWIFPNFKWCPDKNCFSFSNIENIQNHLESIYLRFGWSLLDKSDSIAGIRPTCFQNKSDKSSPINKGELTSPEHNILISSSMDADIFLFENNPDRKGTILVNFYNPIHYFLVVNGNTLINKRTWISKEISDEIGNLLRENNIINISSSNDYILSDFRKLNPSFKKFSPSKSKKILFIPDFLSQCKDLETKLNKKTLSHNIIFKCEDISKFVNDYVLTEKEWHAFISPLTPGLPGKNALEIQYFNQQSSDHWLGMQKPELSKIQYIGQSDGMMAIRKNTFCSIKPNPLGLSDLIIDDFVGCH